MLRIIGSPEAAAYGWPAIHPIQCIEQHRSFRKADRAFEVRIVPVDRVLNRPPLAAGILKDIVMPGSDPAVAVHTDDRRTADATRQQRGSFTVYIGS